MEVIQELLFFVQDANQLSKAKAFVKVISILAESATREVAVLVLRMMFAKLLKKLLMKGSKLKKKLKEKD